MGGPTFPLRKKSNPPVSSAKDEKELAYLYASNANVSNFVSVRLSGDRNYHLWKTQMLCLLEAHDMRGLVDDGPTPTYSSSKMKKKYDSLLRGWIFGSVSEDVLCVVVHHDSAKPVWKSLESYFGSCKTSDQQDPKKANTTKDKNVLLEEKTGTDKGMIPAKSEAQGSEEETVQSQIGIEADPEIKEEDVDSAPFDAKCEDAAQTKTKDSTTTKEDTETKTKGNDTVSGETTTNNKGLRATKAKAGAKAVSEVFFNVELIELHAELQRNSKDINAELHKAVVSKCNDKVRAILSYIDDPEGLTVIKNDKGSTVLHIAAIVDNKDAAELLLKKNDKLLDIKDNQGKTPLHMAYENMSLDTGFVMLKALDDQESSKKAATLDRNSKSYNILDEYINVLVQAISAKKYVCEEKVWELFGEGKTNEGFVVELAMRGDDGVGWWAEGDEDGDEALGAFWEGTVGGGLGDCEGGLGTERDVGVGSGGLFGT
ncbi:hypothetical protein E3N88_26559 [Mikania micrantha]|uniref:Uncharacterized protein n=1 Tax=Mikania micrantha TaxID=192012 RepID=A0A5N6MUC6_9ASTR|nr:hypothetical protein E3N88_26559 [Mikania micrantha]